MDKQQFREIQVSTARWTLRARLDAMEYAEQARATGDKKSARFWDSQVRKTEKLIKMYGLERYGPI